MLIAGVENTNYDLCPTEEEKYTFVKCYLERFNGCEVQGAEIESWLADMPVFEAVSHHFYTLIVLNNRFFRN